MLSVVLVKKPSHEHGPLSGRANWLAVHEGVSFRWSGSKGSQKGEHRGAPNGGTLKHR